MMKFIVFAMSFGLICHDALPLQIPSKSNSTENDDSEEKVSVKHEMQGVVDSITKIKNRVQSMRGIMAGNYTDSIETNEFEESASYETLIKKVDTVKSKIKELQQTLKNIGNILDDSTKKYNITV